MNATLAQCLGPDVVRQIIEAGYNLDFFDDPLLAGHGKVVTVESTGRHVHGSAVLAFGDVRYRVVVLPGVERMPLATLRTLDDVRPTPGGSSSPPGACPHGHPAFRRAPPTTKPFEAWRSACSRGRSAGHFRRIGRRARLGDCEAPTSRCFLLTRRARAGRRTPPYRRGRALLPGQHQQRTAGAPWRRFRVEGLQPEWWDPLSGRIEAAPVVERSREGTTVALDLAPYESQVLVFTQRTLPPRPAGPKGAAAPPTPLDVSRDWSVSFGPDQAPVQRETLHSWTEDDATRHFSGVATYEKTVRVPESMLATGLRLELDFGAVKATSAPATGRMQAVVEVPVREAAIVYVNGRRRGSIWCPPYRLDVTGLLHPGENQIKVEVANLALNAMAGHPLPDYTARLGPLWGPVPAPGDEPGPADYRRPARSDRARRDGAARAAVTATRA